MVIEIERTRSLDEQFPPEQLYGAIYGGERNAHKFIITSTRDGAEITLSGTVTARFLRADNVDVALEGTIEGGKACVTLGDECYAVPGRYKLAIFVTSGTETLCVYAAIGNSDRTAGSSTVDGGEIIESVADLIADIEAARATIPATYTNLMAGVAGTYDATKTYAVGDYAWYDGQLKRCIVPITTAESWNAAHWTNAIFGDDLASLKSALIYDERTLGLPVEIDNVYDSYSVPKGNGTFYNSRAEIWKATDYISIDGIDLIYYQGMSQGSGSSVIVPIAFYDIDKNFLSAETNSTSGMHIQSGIAKVPSNAKYYKQSRYINPNDHDIPNSNNYTKYTYTDADYPVPKTINDLYKRCILGYFFTGHLELDTVNRVLTVKTGSSDVILTGNQKSIHTGIPNNQTYITPDANNYAILYKESTQTIVFMTGSANGANTDDYVFLGCYAYGYIYNALGLIKVNGEVKNKTIESALANSSTQQIASIISSINALSSNLTSEISTRQTADTALGARIDNLVAPSGDSIAEVTDARVGISGTLYASLEARLNAEIGSLFGKIGNILTVGTNKDYQSVAAAVNASNAGDIILIDDGIYTERIVNRDKCIAIIGTSKDGTIIQYPNNDYSRPPLEMAKGVLKNLTLHATEVENTQAAAYALHCDFQGSGVIGGYMYCDNVKFINDNYRAVGLGTRGSSRIEFANCDFVSYASSEALYMHDANDTAYDINNQYLSFRNCTFHNNSSTKHTIEVVSQERQIGVAHVEWQRNIVVNDNTGGTIAMTHYQGRDLGADNWMGSSDWVLDTTSALNTESIMNN